MSTRGRMSQYGSAKFPLRISSMNWLSNCELGAILSDARFEVSDDTVGEPAHTGTAIGRVIELCQGGESREDALKRALQEGIGGAGDTPGEFPLADFGLVERMMIAYLDDPRNQPGSEFGDVIAETQESTVRLRLPPSPDDPTGEDICMVGHLDQVRLMPNGTHVVWDLKSGKKGGSMMNYNYAGQLAAYTLAYQQSHPEVERVQLGGVIRLRGYIARGNPDPAHANVFFSAGWDIDTCRAIVFSAIEKIARIRSGVALMSPGDACSYCDGGGPAMCHQLLPRG